MSDFKAVIIDGGAVHVQVFQDLIPVVVGSPDDPIGVQVFLETSPYAAVLDNASMTMNILQGVPGLVEIADAASAAEEAAAYAAGAKLVIRTDLL